VTPKALAQNPLEDLAGPFFGSSASENSTRRGTLVLMEANMI
jgi:hypothetical protein